MVTSEGISIAELSKTHKVLLFFTSSLGCIFCKGTINDIYELQDELLKLNCIPIIAHEEDYKTYDKFLNSCQANNKFSEIIHIERKPFVKKFQLKHFGMMAETGALIKRGLTEMSRLSKLGLKLEPYTYFMKETTTVLAACFVVYKQKIISEYRKEHKHQRFDIARILIDTDGTGIEIGTNLYDCDYPKKKSGSIDREVRNKKSASLGLNIKTPLLKRFFTQSSNTSPIDSTITNGRNSSFSSLTSKTSSDKKSSFSNSFDSKIEKYDCENEKKNQNVELDLSDVMKDKKSMKYLKLFATRELSVENVLFYEEVQKYRLMNDEQRAIRAEQIHQIFFSSDSVYEINTARKFLICLEERRRNGNSSSELFDSVLRDVVNSNLMDTFQRFKLSELFVDMQQKNKKKSYPYLLKK
eukprot:gene2739-4148_t